MYYKKAKTVIALIVFCVCLCLLFVFITIVERPHPYSFDNTCGPVPTLAPEKVAVIAQYAGFPNVGGAWSIKYETGQPRGGNPFSDSCIWEVSTTRGLDNPGPGATGMAFMYVEDSTKRFWRPERCFDRSKGQWCQPKPEDIPLAPCRS